MPEKIFNDDQDEFDEKVSQEQWFIDLGKTGLKRSAGIVDEEFLPALQGTRAVKVYNEMWKNNATVHALVFTITQLLSRVKWTVTIDDRTPDGEKAVKFLESVMDDMSVSWSETITEILTSVVFGWSYHEIVYKRRIGPWEKEPHRRSKYTDGLIGWRKIPIRAQETMQRWVFDDHGGIRGMVQMAAPTYEQIFIPIEKALLFRVGTHKNNPEGTSFLRGAYRPWYFLKRMEEIEAVAVERDMAGVPVAKMPSRLMQSKDPKEREMFNAFKNLVKNMRRDEHSGIVFPSDVDKETKMPIYSLELMSASGSHTFDTSGIIQRLQKEILMTVLADFIMLGSNSTGSFAMHVDKTGIFKQALNSVIQSIADVFNRHAVPRLFALNGWRPQELPKFKPEPVENPNLGELASFMTSMASLGEEWFPDPVLSKYIRDVASLPELSDEREEALTVKEERSIADSFMEESQAQEKEAMGMTSTEEPPMDPTMEPMMGQEPQQNSRPTDLRAQ